MTPIDPDLEAALRNLQERVDFIQKETRVCILALWVAVFILVLMIATH